MVHKVIITKAPRELTYPVFPRIEAPGLLVQLRETPGLYLRPSLY